MSAAVKVRPRGISAPSPLVTQLQTLARAIGRSVWGQDRKSPSNPSGKRRHAVAQKTKPQNAKHPKLALT
jgi:hypothetical protein